MFLKLNRQDAIWRKLLQDVYRDPDKFMVNINENIKKNGERLWIEWHNKANFDREGNRTGHIAIGVDITDRVRAERLLRISEEKYRLLFETMSEAFAIFDIIYDDNNKPSDYRFIKINPSYENHTGVKGENLIGKSLLEVWPGTENYWMDTYREVAQSGESRKIENFASNLNRYFRVFAFCPQPGQIATLFEDVTDRRIAENKLKKSKEKLDIALESGHIGIWERNLKNNDVTLGRKDGRDFRTWTGDLWRECCRL